MRTRSDVETRVNLRAECARALGSLYVVDKPTSGERSLYIVNTSTTIYAWSEFKTRLSLRFVVLDFWRGGGDGRDVPVDNKRKMQSHRSQNHTKLATGLQGLDSSEHETTTKKHTRSSNEATSSSDVN